MVRLLLGEVPSWVRRRLGAPSPALVVSLVALFVALGGTTYAATSLPRNSVGAKQLKKNAVRTRKIKNGAVTGKKLRKGSVGTAKIRNGAVTAAKINTSGLTVPVALQAADASLLAGVPASSFLSVSGTAADSSLLGGHAASYFLPASGTAADSSLLGGHAASYFLAATGTAADSSLLGGHAASYFLPASGTAVDSSMLGGYPAATFYRLRSGPAANTITSPDTGGVGTDTSITIGVDGLPVISYYDVANETLKVLHCGDTTCSSGNTVTTADNTFNVGTYTSITIGADGLPLISYSDDGNTALKVLHCGNSACSSGNTITTVDVGPNVGAPTSVTVGTDGNPLIAYGEIPGGLKVVHCTDTTCSSTDTPTTVDTGSVGGFASVTVGADGLPLISYWDAGNGALKVLHCSLIDCSNTGTNTITTVDSGGVGEYTSVTVGTDGLPLVSYFAYSGALKVLHCSLIDCSNTGTNTITTVDTGNVGDYTSVTVGADGLPLISYSDFGNHDLKVLHCGNSACSSGNTATTVDAGGHVGDYTSVTVGADGLPLVSYQDATNGALKVLHCANAFCVSYFRRR